MTKITLNVMEITSAIANAANTAPKPAAVPLLLSSQVSLLGTKVEAGFRAGGLEGELSAMYKAITSQHYTVCVAMIMYICVYSSTELIVGISRW